MKDGAGQSGKQENDLGASSRKRGKDKDVTINLQRPDLTELKPRIVVFGVGGGGCNAVNNMIEAGMQGVEFVVANTDAQALTASRADRVIQMGVAVTQGLGAGAQPEIGRAAAEETIDEINDHLAGTHMAFITAGMGGGTGTGAAPVVARAARDAGILTVGVVTKPFHFEGRRRLVTADQGIEELKDHVDTLIVIPNQNLFRIANDKTTFADAFGMADEVLYSGVGCITDLMVKEGLINLDFADVRSVMREMGKAMMGTGEASGERRAIDAAEAAISNPLLDDVSMRGAQGLLISVTGGRDMTLFEVDEAASRIREEVDEQANIIFGATFDESLEGVIRVSVVATGIEEDSPARKAPQPSPESEPRAAPRLSVRSREADADRSAPVAAAAGRGGPAGNRPLASDPDIEINPLRRQSAHYIAPQNEAEQDSDAGPFIPPAAEKPAGDAPRMPTVDDFPAIAQRQLRNEPPPRPPHFDYESQVRQRGGILKRLAQVGRGKRVDEPSAEAKKAATGEPTPPEGMPRPAKAGPQAPRTGERPDRERTTPPQLAQSAPAPRRTGEPAPPAGGLDPQGRSPSKDARSSSQRLEDELEIPAFLRRQSS